MPASARRFRWWHLGVLTAVAALVLTGVFGAGRLYSSSPQAEAAAQAPSEPTATKTKVETIRPTKGGISRRTTQPGSAHSFESAELYAKISGYLGTLHVDIGSRVKRGDLLAEIEVPELARDVDAADATCHRARARVAQAEASVATAIADHQAAESRIAQAKAEVERCQSATDLCQKQLERITDLSGKKGIEARVVDEKICELQTAQASQRAADSAVGAARQQAAAAESRVALAKADLEVARADERIAAAQLERAKVMASYMVIKSPYDGVVTCRNFHRGDYIRSPDQGGQVPLLEVDRTDQMRVVVHVPERDVPFIQPGDRATVRFDALPQRAFTAPVARVSLTEEPATRSMQAEIDLPNPDGIVCDHMYGRVEIALEEPPNGVTVPSACLVGDVADGQAKLFVVEDGHAKERQVQVGRDTGVEVEVLSGLAPEDAVVVRPPGGLTSGSEVAATAVSALSRKQK